MSTYSHELEGPWGRASGAGQLILWAGAVTSLLDGITTFSGLRHNDVAEVNALQSLAIQHYGLPGAIFLRVLIGTTVFAFLSLLFRRWTGWGKRLFLVTSLAGIAATLAFVVNNLSVLYLRHTLLPGMYLHSVYVAAEHLLGIAT